MEEGEERTTGASEAKSTNRTHRINQLEPIGASKRLNNQPKNMHGTDLGPLNFYNSCID